MPTQPATKPYRPDPRVPLARRNGGMKMRRLALSLSLLCNTGLAAADDAAALADMESLLSREVTGPSRFSQTLGDSPASVTLASDKDIWEYGFRTVAEALMFAPSAYTSDDRAYTYLGARGFSRPGDYNSRVVLLADGIPLNDPIYDQAPLGHESPLDTGWLKRVEFAQGPSSAPNGGNAMFGVINAQLLDGQDIEGRYLSLGLGDRGTHEAKILAGGVTDGGSDWMIGLAHAGDDGEDLHFPEYVQPGVGDGWARGLDDERHTKFVGKISHDAWQTHLLYSERRKNIPTGYYDTEFARPGTWTQDRYYYLGLRYTGLSTPTLEQGMRIYMGHYNYDADYLYDYGVNRDIASASWWGTEYKGLYTGIENHALAAGFDSRFASHTEQRNFDIDTGQYYLDDSRDEDRIGVFMEDQWRPFDTVVVNLGYRVDRQSDGKTVGSPRLALIYRPSPTTALKLIHGTGYRQPNTYERYYGDSGYTQKGNPNLSSEKIASYELALDHLLSPWLHLGFSAYRYRLKNLISQSTDPTDGLLVFANEPEFHIVGAEFQATAVLAAGLNGKASLALQNVDDAATLYNSPRYLAKLFLNGPLGWERWRFTLGVEALGERNTALGRVDRSETLNLSLHKALLGGEVGIHVYNALDSDAHVPAPTGFLQDSLPTAARRFAVVWKTAIR